MSVPSIPSATHSVEPSSTGSDDADATSMGLATKGADVDPCPERDFDGHCNCKRDAHTRTHPRWLDEI